MYGIFTYICLMFMVNVGKYNSAMDAMGLFFEVFCTADGRLYMLCHRQFVQT